MKQIIIAIILITISLLSFADNNWKIYTIKEVGFSIKYPNDLSISVKNSMGILEKETILYESINNNSLLELNIYITNIEKIIPEPLRYDKASALEEKALLDNGKVGYGLDWPKDVTLKKVADIYGETYFILARGMMDEISLKRDLLFFHNNYRIIISLNATKIKSEAIKTMPEYFSKISNCSGGEWDCYGWNAEGNSLDGFIKSLKQGKGGVKIQEWYTLFEEIIDTIQIDNKIYKTRVNKLRLRESFTLSSKLIRNLELGEELQFIDQTHNTQKIDNIEGYWIKCKTKNNEIGWCFSGYLEEIK